MGTLLEKTWAFIYLLPLGTCIMKIVHIQEKLPNVENSVFQYYKELLLLGGSRGVGRGAGGPDPPGKSQMTRDVFS